MEKFKQNKRHLRGDFFFICQGSTFPFWNSRKEIGKCECGKLQDRVGEQSEIKFTHKR